MNERNTEQKRIIMGALACADHPTASELYEEIHKTNPRISRATVFRVLAHAADSGAICRLSLAGEDARYDARPYAHAHMHCVRCGRVFDIFDSSLNDILNTEKISDFTVLSTRLEFSGICGDCAEKEI